MKKAVCISCTHHYTERMAPILATLRAAGYECTYITSDYNHLVTSFGLKVMSPVYDLMQILLDAGVSSEQKFSVDPRPMDPKVPANFLQKLKRGIHLPKNYFE